MRKRRKVAETVKRRAVLADEFLDDAAENGAPTRVRTVLVREVAHAATFDRCGNMIVLTHRTENTNMTVHTTGEWGARCDFEFIDRIQSGCGERITLNSTGQASFVRALRRHGWAVSRSTNEALIRYAEKPIGLSEEEWDATRPKSVYAARCPAHVGHR